jgi:putative endonuclease
MEEGQAGRPGIMSEEGRGEAYALGRRGEEIALEYLRRKGYRIVARGFRLFRGEIDIIARCEDTLVFVEVKTRATTEFGLPEEAVTPAKQAQVRKIARGFLVERDLGEPDCRFDVLAILVPDGGDPVITHYESAF